MKFHKIYVFTAVFILFFSSCFGICTFEGQTYAEGKSWNSSCNICKCNFNTVTCTKIACPQPVCKTGEVLSQSSDSCCPQCIPLAKPCSDGNISHMHNDVWSSSSNCILYHCRAGNVVPFVIQCPPIVCSKNEIFITLPGECCPTCIVANCTEDEISNKEKGALSSCFHQNFSSSSQGVSTSTFKKSLDATWKNECSLCINDRGKENCYTQKCPLCQIGIFYDEQNSCCSCSHSICSNDCSSCLANNTDYCTGCNDLTSILHEGKCVTVCPPYYFKDENRQCKKCPPLCQSCFGNMISQCTGCIDGYVLQKGRCLKSCDSNYFESDGQCYECHESCSSCLGPNVTNCVSCALSGQLLQDGMCVDKCVGHFYVSDGYCQTCNESCARCLIDGTCQFCEENLYLEDGHCVLSCSPGYYTFLDAYCLPCHEECQMCFGPLAFHCTSCPFGLFLLENSCVGDCGQGYFGDLGAGICRTCHSNCRSCLEGSADDKCLTCSSGYLLPYIGTHFGPCVDKCPPQYFPMDDGTCMPCHETCDMCYGSNDTECTSCNSSLFFKNGRCVPHCSAGFFQDSGICYACHPSCATCYGFTSEECYTCPVGRSLKYGRCVSVCDEGKYKDVDGICRECHSSCSDCLLSNTDNGTSLCLLCKNQQLSIINDKCTTSCQTHFYLNSNHACQECHSTCATCERDGATSCASCWDGNFLTHLGTCEPHCPQGCFPFNGVCQACSSICYHCNAATNCLQCKDDLVLQFGECVSVCSQQHYVDSVSRQCKECSWECNTCRGPLPTDCTSCMDGKLFQDGTCVKDCIDGFYEEGNVCKTCDLKCRTCSSLNTCTSCDLPLLLLNGGCVDDCGSEYYADYETLKCNACSNGCVYCLSADHCGLCLAGFYLLNDYCVQQCPSDYFPDPIKRKCEKNTEAPSLKAIGTIKVYLGATVLITASLLHASDEDSDSLLILVHNIPQNGELLQMSEMGEEIALSPGRNFTSNQLKDGWIFFRHLKGLPLDGELVLKISDGHLTGNQIVLPLEVISEFQPSVQQTKYFALSEESLIILNSTVLNVEDKDNIEDVSLQVVQDPCCGKLVLMPDQKEVSKVSYQEFITNTFAFKSSKISAPTEDKFILQISDHYTSKLTEVRFFILPKDDNHLFVVRKKPIIVTPAEVTKLSNNEILVVSEDLSPSEIVFSIEKVSLLPNGQFSKIVDNATQATEIIKGNRIEFSQDDINKGKIFYSQSNGKSLSNVLHFKVSSTKSPVSKFFDLEIYEAKLDALIPLLGNQFGMMVLQNHPATITSDHLLVKIDGISPNDIVYAITKKLLKSEGFLENVDKPGYKLQSFTQQDVNNMKIVYHPPTYGESTETQYIFQFIVIDAKRGSQLTPEQNFTITVRPVSSDVTSPSSSIDHETTILVNQGQSVDLGFNWLSTVGHEVPDDQLEVVLSISPQHGVLIHMQNGVETEIEEDDGFSFTSIINDAYYKHDGSDKFKDSAVFKIMGGPYSSLNRVNFVISPNDRESPVILDSTTLMGSVIEGGFLDLQRYHLAYTDLISGDPDIIFTLLTEPKYGALEKKQNGFYHSLKQNDAFTQQDINELLMRYTANSGIGDEIVRDFIHFDVADGSGNVQSNQVLTMKVKPKIKEPPVVKIISDVQVHEGGEAIIEPHIMIVSDRDTPLSDLEVLVEGQPEYGFLENSRPIPGAEKTLAGIPISSFPYIDLVEGYIKYMQGGVPGVEPERDTVYIRISDGHLSSPVHLINITIKPVNDEIPHVFTDVLIVNQGGYSKILNSTLSVTDVDTKPDHLIITLDTLPQKGVIKILQENNPNFLKAKLLLNKDSFTFQDILDNLLVYVHDDTKSAENDTFAIIVSDGRHLVSSAINISVIVTDKEVPFLLRNLGLEITPGNSSVITSDILCASDTDSPDHLLVYTLTADLTSGQLLLLQNGKLEELSSSNIHKRKFTQLDIDQQNLIYRHNIGNRLGMHHFKFTVSDPGNNTLMDQRFFISVSEDIFPPIVIQNSGLVVKEKSSACITSDILAAVDEHKKHFDLIFSLASLPNLGYLEHINNKGNPISSFYMSDLSTGSVCYVHTSNNYNSFDSFTFTVSDGKNYVLQPFYVNITSGADAMPSVKIKPLIVQEGGRKIISEFEIDIHDRDSSEMDILIKVVKPPVYGTLQDSDNLPTARFSANDITQGKIYYFHDDSDNANDNFSFTISDKFNKKFIFALTNGSNITTEGPIVFPIVIIPVDDASPVLVKNEGLNTFKIENEKIWNTITKDNLYAEDFDTDEENILYSVTLQPQLGFLKLKSTDKKISQFTQKDVNNNAVQYVLLGENFDSTEDKFMFSIEDTKPNKIFNNIFHIKWTRVMFGSSLYNASESDGHLEIPVVRIGNTDLDYTVLCEMKEENKKQENHKKNILLPVADEIHFRKNDTEKYCIYKLIDNAEYEGKKRYKATLKSPAALLGSPKETFIDIYDEEDEPVVSFKEAVFYVNETNKYFQFPVLRHGDSELELSLMCTTSDLTASGSSTKLQSGSDYISRDMSYGSFITFSPGLNETTCNVKIIDDSLFEEDEEFEISLSNLHPLGKLQNPIKARVIIRGPNDVPYVSIKQEDYEFFYGWKNLSVNVIRHGVDMSKPCCVWCGSHFSTNHKKEENMNTFQKISFEAFETSAECPVQNIQEEYQATEITVFLDSPNGCLLGEQSVLTIPLTKEKLGTVVEFEITHIVVKEESGTVQIPVLRTGDLNLLSYVHCITHSRSALEREDFKERYQSHRYSFLSFGPGEKETFCPVTIYDDEVHEIKESFEVELTPHIKDDHTLIGTRKTAIVEIIDTEDATLIQLEKPEYASANSKFPNTSNSVIVSVIRHGDLRFLSKVRVSTIDGSASSGIDYYAKSKLISFYPGERRKHFDIEILYNKRRNWALFFTVILGPDEVWNAELGNISRAVVTIPGVLSTESLILPSVPVVISLLYYNNVTKGLLHDGISGYPLICITPCDTNYPDYAATSSLCALSGINSSSLSYSWEISMPLDKEQRISSFERVTDSTLFTSVHHRVLDSIYFRPHEIVRCVVQPIDSKGHLGIPLRSKSIKISSDNGFCHTSSRTSFSQPSLQSQPFIASLEYINSSDAVNPNKLHIHIEIPHEDGLLPLISTYPLHNIQFLLTQNIYRQQHVCSNLFQVSSSGAERNRGFLRHFHPLASDIKQAYPYNGMLCQKETKLLYQHLDLKKCKWSFDAWYGVSELTELCGGSITSDFKTRDTDETYVTVLLPLYITYVFAAAPTGWSSVEHKTEMEFSFFYDTFLWKSGSHSSNELSAKLAVVRVGTDSAGHLFFEFKTTAKFYGCFVMEHHTLPGVKSHISVPDNMNVQFNLDLLWSEQTFDGPIQFWKATSNYNLKDYSGYYSVQLIPCRVTSSEQFSVYNGNKFLPCVAQIPQKFGLPLAFQQTVRPPPVTYELETFFQLFNDENLFLLNPFTNSLNFQYIEYKGAFSKGQNVYGRVFWSPQQELDSAYHLHINEVMLCTGRNGYVPIYDPAGKIYGKGPQYGCLLPNKNIRHNFILLNKDNPEAITTAFQGIPFNAQFIEDSKEFLHLAKISGVDGFVFNIDPLYEVSPSQHWFLQVMYTIKPTKRFRNRRSVEDNAFPVKDENGTNIKIILLQSIQNEQTADFDKLSSKESFSLHQGLGAHHIMYILSAFLIFICIIIVSYRKSNFLKYLSTSGTNNSYVWSRYINKPLNVLHNDKLYEIKCKQKVKKSQKCTVKVYSEKQKVNYKYESSSETEV